MKKTIVLFLILLLGCVSFISLSAALPDEPDDPTFYFTRLVYTENGRRGFMGTLRKPSVQFVCPEFGGGAFFPRQGWGWATDYPGGDCKFMGGIHRLAQVADRGTSGRGEGVSQATGITRPMAKPGRAEARQITLMVHGGRGVASLACRYV